MPGGRPPSDPKQRFLAKVKRADSGCDEFQSSIQKDGYGRFHFRGQQWQAHRVAYTLFVGEISEGVRLLHSCDNRCCVKVEHLRLGSDADNIRDMDAKGRRGTKAKLSASEAAVILKLLNSRVSQAKVAAAFGVDQTTVSRIKLGKTKLFKEP